VCGIGSHGLGDEFVVPDIPHFHLSPQVAESSQDQDLPLGAVEGCVARPGSKVKHRITLQVENRRFGRHKTINSTKLSGTGVPDYIINGAIFC
jgi:hypothetical protein